jgi:3-deoxy-D-glycero-D-galacto-nononate 9-phosphatase
MLPKLVITDIDGVWTDGGMYYDQTGNEWKKFNTSDSAGVLFLRLLDIPLAIITSENTQILKNRARKLKIDLLFEGVTNKLAVVQILCNERSIDLSEVAYIGDDLNDIPVLQKVGWAVCPNNAPDYVKRECNAVTKKSGGEGAFREFVEDILITNNKLEEVLRLHQDIIAHKK